MRCLIVDDNPADRALLGRELRAAFEGIFLVEAGTSDAFESAMAGLPFDAIVTDLHLRWATGLDVLRPIRARGDVPVVMFTGTGNEAVAAQAFGEGMDDDVVKDSFSDARVARSLTRALERRHVSARAQQLVQVIEQSPNMVVLTDAQGIVQYVNQRYVDATGKYGDTVIGRPFDDLGGRITPVVRAVRRTLESGAPWSGEYVAEGTDGCRYGERATVSPLRNDCGTVTGCVLIATDVSDEIALARRVEYLSLHDALTGLPNRRLLLERCQHALTELGARDHGVASCASTSTPSRWSTTALATGSAIWCCGRSRPGCKQRSVAATPWRGSGATSSPSCSTTPTRTRVSQTGCCSWSSRSNRPCDCVSATCRSARASASRWRHATRAMPTPSSRGHKRRSITPRRRGGARHGSSRAPCRTW